MPTFTKSLAIIQQYIYKKKIEDDWEEHDGQRYTIDVYLCQKYNTNGEEVGGVVLKIIYNGSDCGEIIRWCDPAILAEKDVWEDTDVGLKKYYLFEKEEGTFVYVSKVYDMAETDGFKIHVINNYPI